MGNWRVITPVAITGSHEMGITAAGRRAGMATTTGTMDLAAVAGRVTKTGITDLLGVVRLKIGETERIGPEEGINPAMDGN